MYSRFFLFRTVLLSISIMIVSCTCTSTPEGSPSIALEWEILVASEGDGDYSYQGLEPKIVGVTDMVSAETLTHEIQPMHLQTLKGVNFEKNIAVVIYQGQRATLGYSIEIDDVQFQEQDIIVYARFLQPEQDWLENISSSPYCVLRIQKNAQLTGNLFLVLLDDGKEISRAKYFIP